MIMGHLQHASLLTLRLLPLRLCTLPFTLCAVLFRLCLLPFRLCSLSFRQSPMRAALLCVHRLVVLCFEDAMWLLLCDYLLG